MKYEVWAIGFESKEPLEFHFDNMGDAIDFASTCVENGHSATVIPLFEEGDLDDGE